MTTTQLRIDPLSGLKVIVAPGRAARPGAFLNEHVAAERADDCPFCEGHEQETPPEVWALRAEGSAANTPGWRVRVVPNKFPLLSPDAATTDKPEPAAASTSQGDPELFAAHEIGGAHEVIVHSPNHLVSIGELSEAQLRTAVEVWRERIGAHAEAAYVQLIVNEGHRAGASLEHTHAQLYALPLVPIEVARERERFNAFAHQANGACLLCEVLHEEVRLRERLVAIDDDAALLAPFASRLPYQLQIVPRRHEPSFETSGDAAVGMLGRALKLLKEAFGGSPPLNIWVRTAPSGAEQFHWHIEIVPRLTELAGLELGTGLAANICAPEQVAKELRD